LVDAAVSARSALTIERSFTLAELPRVRQAGAADGSGVTVGFHFLELEGRVAIDGRLRGVVKLTCQRCMGEADIGLEDEFHLIIVRDESELGEEIVGYEPILADPARLDVRELAEEQTLLALPLVPMHAAENCDQEDDAAAADEPAQRPFENL